MRDLTVCDWAGPCWALYHSKEMIKNLIELSDTETYEGVPAKHALILSAVSTFLLFIHKVCEAAEGLKIQPQNWQEIKVNINNLHKKYIDFHSYFSTQRFILHTSIQIMLFRTVEVGITKLRILWLAKYLEGAKGLTHLSCRITKDEISTGGISAKVSKAAQSSAMITPFWKTYKAEHPASDGPGSSGSGS